MSKVKEFIPKQKTKIDKKTGKTVKVDLYRGTTLDEIIDFLDSEDITDEERAEFKANYNKQKVFKTIEQYTKKDGKTGTRKKDWTGEYEPIKDPDKGNFLLAKEKFFEKYAPKYLPKKTEKKKPTDRMAKW